MITQPLDGFADFRRCSGGGGGAAGSPIDQQVASADLHVEPFGRNRHGRSTDMVCTWLRIMGACVGDAHGHAILTQEADDSLNL